MQGGPPFFDERGQPYPPGERRGGPPPSYFDPSVREKVCGEANTYKNDDTRYEGT